MANRVPFRSSEDQDQPELGFPRMRDRQVNFGLEYSNVLHVSQDSQSRDLIFPR